MNTQTFVRAWVCFFAALVIALVSASCERQPVRTVVLYSSVDAGVLRPIIERYETSYGVKVQLVTDTEATKTTGLVERLINEKSEPRADLWWSGEIIGTLQLSRAGVLETYACMAAESVSPWPPGLRGKRGDWYGLALRPRIIVFNTKTLKDPEFIPRTLADLAEPRCAVKGVGIADPAFGTTRGHVAAMYSVLGEKVFHERISAVRWRVYDGNASVVRAVANGEIDVGITDYDDARAAERNNWPLGVAFMLMPNRDGDSGSYLTPGTVALVRGGPNAAEAKLLLDFILSRQTEEQLATGEWSSLPVFSGAKSPDPRLAPSSLPPPANFRWELIVDIVADSSKAWKSVLEAEKK